MDSNLCRLDDAQREHRKFDEAKRLACTLPHDTCISESNKKPFRLKRLSTKRDVEEAPTAISMH